MGWVKTHKGFVNTWECDENDHMNVQFYYSRFAHGGGIFATLNGRDRQEGARPGVRHVRFHREIKYNVSTVVRSAVIGDGECKGRIAHLLADTNSGMISATALDTVSFSTDGIEQVSSADAAPALPRGLGKDAEIPGDTDALLKSGRGIVSNMHVVQPSDCDGWGNLSTQHFIGRFTDGASHIWDHAGLTTQWLEENRFGRVAVEMKLCPLCPVTAGTPLRQISWVEAMNEKTFRIRHQLENMETAETVATGAVVGLVIDLRRRCAASIPQTLVESFSEQRLPTTEKE